MQKKRRAETRRGGGAERTWTQRERDGHAEREEDTDPERGRWWSRKVRMEAQRRGVEWTETQRVFEEGNLRKTGEGKR